MSRNDRQAPLQVRAKKIRVRLTETFGDPNIREYRVWKGVGMMFCLMVLALSFGGSGRVVAWFVYLGLVAALFWACYGPVAGRQPGRPTLTHLATALTSLAISGAASFSNWTF
ncbi:MAG TPA: hypothetical protein DD390_00850 [Rhodospirillaceae bacterium]|nr:hypothetical protein [Rhodospirillaceae bacterium]MAX61873.1 hypothetical protein [Rhodospirillaceae bacterium]HBM11221.1 hypothetical protein [Rhodospirillaceae bacterium]|tara:strand:+ start:1459 stop:1797 length:339 start_codon:yes stop_codon:yes gene_type:complete